MKNSTRLISAILAAMLCATVFSACANGAKPSVTGVTTDAPVADVTTEGTDTASHTLQNEEFDTVPDDTKDSADVGIFASVLSGKAAYYEDGKEQYVLKDSEFVGFNYTQYVMLDMDGDGEYECLLRSQQTVLILYVKENEIHGCTCGFRAMDSVYENGTFSWHGFSELDGSESSGLSKIIAFTPKGMKNASIWRVDAYASNSPRYYIGEDNKEVSKAEFDAYKMQYAANTVKWIDY